MSTHKHSEKFIGMLPWAIAHTLTLVVMLVWAAPAVFRFGRVYQEEGSVFWEQASRYIEIGLPLQPFLYNGHLDLLPWLGGHLAAIWPVTAPHIFVFIAIIPYLCYAMLAAHVARLAYLFAHPSGDSNIIRSRKTVACLAISAVVSSGAVSIFNDGEVFLNTTNSQWVICCVFGLRTLHPGLSSRRQPMVKSQTLPPWLGNRIASIVGDFLIMVSSFPAALLFISMLPLRILRRAPTSYSTRWEYAPGLLVGSLLQVLLTMGNLDTSTQSRRLDPWHWIPSWFSQGVLGIFTPGPFLVRLSGAIQESVEGGSLGSLLWLYILPGLLISCLGWFGVYFGLRSLRRYPDLRCSFRSLILLGIWSSALFSFLSRDNPVAMISIGTSGRYFFAARCLTQLGLLLVVITIISGYSTNHQLAIKLSPVILTLALAVISGGFLFHYLSEITCLEHPLPGPGYQELINDYVSGLARNALIPICPQGLLVHLQRA